MVSGGDADLASAHLGQRNKWGFPPAPLAPLPVQPNWIAGLLWSQVQRERERESALLKQVKSRLGLLGPAVYI